MAQAYIVSPRLGMAVQSARRSCHTSRQRSTTTAVCRSSPFSTVAVASLTSAAVCLSATFVAQPVAANDAVEPMDASTSVLESIQDRRSMPDLFALADAPELMIQATGEQPSLMGMIQVADMLSAATSELLNVKEGNSSFPISDVAQKMSQQAMVLASQAVALASYDLPEPERDLLFQIRAAAQQVSTIADSIAKQT